MPLPGLPLFPGSGWPDPNGSLFRDSWHIAGGLHANMRRTQATGTLTVATTATGTICGGMTLPAGFSITGIATWPTTTGSTFTIKHFTLMNTSRVALRSTANSTASMTANANNAVNLSSVYTPLVDTAAYLVISIAATTAPTFQGSPAGSASLLGAANPWVGTITGYTPTTTPPADGATLGSGFTTGTITSVPLFYLY